MLGKEKETQTTEGCCGKCCCDWDECKKTVEEYCKDAECSCNCMEMMRQMCCSTA